MGYKMFRRLFVLLVAFLVGTAAWGQTTGGALKGKVTDEDGEPLIGAVVEVTGPALQGFVATATDNGGYYQVPFVSVGRGYSVKVEATGYRPVVRMDIQVALGTTTILDFSLPKGAEVLDIVGASPLVDTRKTETGAVLSDTLIDAIPLDRDSANIALLAPSAVPNLRPVADMGPSIGGASGPENVYIVNGVDVTGSRDALNPTTLNFDFIEATEVKTGGMDAEWGAATGGAINTITRSGSNEFHGGLFLYYWDDGLGAGERPLRSHTVTNQIESQKIWDLGGFLGGYFIKDKLWFFVAYDYNKEEQDWTAEVPDPYVFLNGRQACSWARDTGYTNDRENPQYALKLTWYVTPNHRAVISFFGDQDDWDRYANLNNPSPVASPVTDERTNWALSLQWNATWTPNFFTELLAARRHTRRDVQPANQAARDNWLYFYRVGGYQVIPTSPYHSFDPTTGRIDLSSWRTSLGGGQEGHQKDVNDQVRLKLTNIFDAAGRHELSYGLQHYDIRYDWDLQFTGPPVRGSSPRLNDSPNPWYGRSSSSGAEVRWWLSNASSSGYIFRAGCFMNDHFTKTTQKYWAYWIQDNWNLTDYFMLKLGLRYDRIDMRSGDNTLNVWGQPAPEYTYQGPDFNGRSRSLKIGGMWAPRVGFTWDVAHNGKSKLYGFLGRYYERVPNRIATRALTVEFYYVEKFEDAALTIPYGDVWCYGMYPTRLAGGGYWADHVGGTLVYTGKVKGAYNDEAILGFQYEIAPDFSVGARAVYRNLGRAIEDITVDGGASYIVTNPGAWTDVWAVGPNFGHGYRYRFPKPARIYTALEITADKRFSDHWQLAGSYVLSRLKGNYEGLYSNDNGQLEPNITTKYDLPNMLLNGYGLLPNDRTHNLKLYGGYHFDFGLDVSARFQLMSGTPISALGYVEFYGTNEGFCKRRGTAGRTPTIWWIDLGLQYNIGLGFSKLGLRVDVFNLTNEQRTTRVDETYNILDTSAAQTNPYFKEELAHQRARRIRLAIRWTF